jgi:hypothetical protein
MIPCRARRAMALLGTVLMLGSAPSWADDPDAGDPLAPAVSQIQNGDLDTAEATLRSLLAGDLGTEDRATALIYLARIQLGSGRFAEADVTAGQAIDQIQRIAEDRDQPLLLALTIRFEAAKAVGDDARATAIAQQVAELSARRDQVAWSSDRTTGAMIHKASGTALPESVAGLAEYQVNTYDEAGLDAALTYTVDEGGQQAGDAPSFVTVHVSVDQGLSSGDAFQASKQEILQRFPDAREISTGPIAVVQDQRRLEGTMGVYSFRINGEPGFATVHVFHFAPDVLVKFAAAYPSSDAEAMRGRVAALMQTMNWPEGASTP